MFENLPDRIKRRLQPNGCTMFLEGTHTACCDLHDTDYAMGIERRVADHNLKDCIRRVREQQYEHDVAKSQHIHWKIFLLLKYSAWRVLAVVIYYFVRSFGWYFHERARWYRESKPSGDNWWIKGRIKMWLQSKY